MHPHFGKIHGFQICMVIRRIGRPGEGVGCVVMGAQESQTVVYMPVQARYQLPAALLSPDLRRPVRQELHGLRLIRQAFQKA